MIRAFRTKALVETFCTGHVYKVDNKVQSSSSGGSGRYPPDQHLKNVKTLEEGVYVCNFSFSRGDLRRESNTAGADASGDR